MNLHRTPLQCSPFRRGSTRPFSGATGGGAAEEGALKLRVESHMRDLVRDKSAEESGASHELGL